MLTIVYTYWSKPLQLTAFYPKIPAQQQLSLYVINWRKSGDGGRVKNKQKNVSRK